MYVSEIQELRSFSPPEIEYNPKLNILHAKNQQKMYGLWFFTFISNSKLSFNFIWLLKGSKVFELLLISQGKQIGLHFVKLCNTRFVIRFVYFDLQGFGTGPLSNCPTQNVRRSDPNLDMFRFFFLKICHIHSPFDKYNEIMRDVINKEAA
jgi:hypothetical protein